MGVVALMLAVAMILATISECGMRGLLVREMARMRDEPEQATKLMAGAMQSRLYSLLPYLLAAGMLGILLLPANYGFSFAAILLAVWFDSNSQVVRGALRAFDRIITDAVLAAVPRLLLLGLCAYLFSKSTLSISNFAVVYFLIALLDYLVSLTFVYRYTAVKPSLGCSHRYTVSLIKRGVPFIVLAVLGTIYLRVGVVLLGLPKTPEALRETAAFNLSGKFPEGVAFVPIALMNVAIPFLSRQSRNLDAIRSVFGRLELLTGGAGLLIAAGLVAFAEELILLLSTPEYLLYATVFRVYGVTVFFSFIQYTYANLLLSMDKEHLVATRYGAILVANIGLNLILIWKFDAIGAVAALLICEIAAVIVDLWFLRGTGVPLGRSVLLKWTGIALLAAGAACLSSQISGIFGLIIYAIIAGLAGAALLFFTQMSPSARDVQTSSATD